jgi:hypothetical protein
MKYIGTKIVEATPDVCVWQDYKTGDIHIEDGYKITYKDGYVSASPKDVFEEAYLPLIENPDLKTDKPSISQQMVDDFIRDVEVMTMGEKTTVVRAVLRNGFEIVESSACVSKENYDQAVGTTICMNRIKSKVWELLGFLLQTAVHGIK